MSLNINIIFFEIFDIWSVHTSFICGALITVSYKNVYIYSPTTIFWSLLLSLSLRNPMLFWIQGNGHQYYNPRYVINILPILTKNYVIIYSPTFVQLG